VTSFRSHMGRKEVLKEGKELMEKVSADNMVR
jgi:hypothetical protein